MAANLSEILSRPAQEHYAKQFVSTFPKDAKTPQEYVAIAAEAYGEARARKIEDLRVSTKVADLAGKAQAQGINTDPLLLNAAEKAREAGKTKVTGKTEIGASGEKEYIVVTLDELIRARQLQEDLARANAKPSGIKRA